VNTVITDIGNIQDPASGQRPLVGKIPGFQVRVFPVQIDFVVALIEQGGRIRRMMPLDGGT